ncbi:MAG: DinB family protein [Planctomycetota bacterium]
MSPVPTKTSPSVAQLVLLLGEAYDKKAWHGPNLKGLLRGMTPAQAAFRLHDGRHNAWELTVHCAYWKYTVTRLLLAEPRGSFPLAGSNWFPRPSDAGAAAWRADRALLEAQHRRLLAAVAALRDRDLAHTPAGSKHTVQRLVLGAAAHDLYHAGQIALLKRSFPVVATKVRSDARRRTERAARA